jgi:hypothetical protein
LNEPIAIVVDEWLLWLESGHSGFGEPISDLC